MTKVYKNLKTLSCARRIGLNPFFKSEIGTKTNRLNENKVDMKEFPDGKKY